MLLRQQRAPGSPARVRRCMSIGLGVVYVCVLCVLLLYVVCVARCVCCAAARGSLCLSVCCVPVHMHASFVGGALWGVCERLVAPFCRNSAIPFIRYAQIKKGGVFREKKFLKNFFRYALHPTLTKSFFESGLTVSSNPQFSLSFIRFPPTNFFNNILLRNI